MSGLIYWVTSETLLAAVEQIPHTQSRADLLPWADSLIAQTSRWEFVSGWWYPRANTLWQYPALPQSSTLNLERAIELNRFITNGVSVRSGGYIALQSSNLSPDIFYKRYLSIPETGSAKQKLRRAIENAVRLRADQVFHDGNHRAALLLLYEVLANQKLLLRAKPMTLYILLSNRSDVFEHGKYEWNEVERRMYQHCRSRLRFLTTVPTSEERPLLYGNEVKTLEVRNSMFNQIAELWFAKSSKLLSVEQRTFVRHLKHVERGIYEQFYRLCIRGSWENPPNGYPHIPN